MMKEYNMKRIGSRIRWLRLKHRHRQHVVAATLKMSQAGYSKLENGECTLSLERAMMLARFYKITLIELLG